MLLESEKESSVRKGLTMLAAHIGLGMVEEGWWPEFMPWIRKSLSNRTVPALRTSSLDVLSEMANLIANSMQSEHAGIATALRATMQDESAPAMVRVAAVRCTAHLLVEFDRSASDAAPFMPLGATCLRVL